jgi:hypothetical protein
MSASTGNWTIFFSLFWEFKMMKNLSDHTFSYHHNLNWDFLNRLWRNSLDWCSSRTCSQFLSQVEKKKSLYAPWLSKHCSQWSTFEIDGRYNCQNVGTKCNLWSSLTYELCSHWKRYFDMKHPFFILSWLCHWQFGYWTGITLVDVCSPHPGTGTMTTPQEFYQNVMSTLTYLDNGVVPPGSHLTFVGKFYQIL